MRNPSPQPKGAARAWPLLVRLVEERPNCTVHRRVRISLPPPCTCFMSAISGCKASCVNTCHCSQTCAWDVRTKRVSYEPVPTADGIAAICNYGPTATLFTIGRNSSIQQYDINPSNGPATMVANVQHAPANTPPSPPISLGEHKKQMETPLTALPSKSIPLILADSESSADEGITMSPLQKIAQEMDQLEEERRDRVGPLSPVSSRGSQSSRSSGSGRAPRYRYDKPSTASQRSTRSKSSGGSGTIFSSGNSLAGTSTRESISIRSISSTASSRYTSSALRKEVLRSPDESKKDQHVDLFPFTKARLNDVPFRSTNLGPERTADDLRLNMLKVVFGWERDIDELVRDECKLSPPTLCPMYRTNFSSVATPAWLFRSCPSFQMAG